MFTYKSDENNHYERIIKSQFLIVDNYSIRDIRIFKTNSITFAGP